MTTAVCATTSLPFVRKVDAALSKMNSADGLSFDTWGVDYGLLNKSGNLLRLPCHYRDTRTAGTVRKC